MMSEVKAFNLLLNNIFTRRTICPDWKLHKR